MSAENKALIRRWFEEVWNKGHAEAIHEMLSDHAVVHSLDKDLYGPEGFKPFYTAYHDAFPDAKIRVEEIVAERNMVAARWSGTGTHQGNGLGFKATGKPVRFSGMVFARVEDSKVVEAWNLFDQFGILHQLGVVEPPPAV